MRKTFKLPKISPAVSSVLVHYLAIFAVAFGSYLATNAVGKTSISALVAVIGAAATAGLVAVGHVILGLVPTDARYGITPKVKTAGYQILTSVAIMFVGTLGAQLATGAVHASTFPDLVAVISAALAAGVFAVVQYLVGLVPAPKPAS